MYRSHGELRSYAKRVFALYANDSSLSISKFKLAWYVLWGKWPDDNVMQLLFNNNNNSNIDNNYKNNSDTVQEYLEETNASLIDNNQVIDNSITDKIGEFGLQSKRITEEEFVRFVAVYFDTMGELDAANFSDIATINSELLYTDNNSPPDALLRVAQWAHFESLAGPKGYVTLEDFIEAENVNWLRQPISGKLNSSSCFSSSFINTAIDQIEDNINVNGSDKSGRMALLSHAFAIVDGDRDGRVVFADMERFLRPTPKR